MKRKYRGALRVAPIREKMVEAMSDDSDLSLYDLAKEASAAGFPNVAREMMDSVHEASGTERCPACDDVLGGKNSYRYQRNACKVCMEHRARRDQAKLTRGQKRKLRSKRFRRRTFTGPSHDHRCWPWLELPKHRVGRNRRGVKYGFGKKRYKLQRSWRHLAHVLPDMNRSYEWTPEDWERHAKIVREENARCGRTSS